MSKKEYLPINWTNGVKLSEDYFRKNHYNIMETIKEYNKMHQNEHSYGVFEDVDQQIEALRIDVVSSSEESITVELKACNAITNSGFHILYYPEIYGTNYPTATIERNELEKGTDGDQIFYLIVSVAPYNAVPVGTPNPDVVPLHHPYALPKISLNILSKQQISRDFINEYHLIVGKIRYRDNVFSLAEGYIPPVIKISYNRQLTDFCGFLSNSMVKMKDCSVQIFKKNKNNSKASHLAHNTFTLCDVILNFFSDNIFYLNNIVKEQAPIELINKIAILANKLSLALSLMNEREREMLLQYYYEWTDMEPSKFMEKITSVVTIQYEHTEIRRAMDKVDQLIVMLVSLLRRMSDLEYIGQRKDNIVVSEEREVVREVVKKPTWRIID